MSGSHESERPASSRTRTAFSAADLDRRTKLQAHRQILHHIQIRDHDSVSGSTIWRKENDLGQNHDLAADDLAATSNGKTLFPFRAEPGGGSNITRNVSRQREDSAQIGRVSSSCSRCRQREQVGIIRLRTE